MSATSTDPTQLDLKLEVVVLGVSDVDRAKAFYEKLGCRVDADHATGDDFRVVQVTPHNSEASIIFGKGITSPRPGSTNSLIFAVDDLDVARDDLIARGVKASAVFHYPDGVFRAGEKSRVAGRDPEGRSYLSFASFEDPDGSGWLLQEIKTRLPGRVWNSTQMNDLQIRAALERHWAASAAGDQDAEHEIYQDDAIVDYPQSGERIHGRHNVQALRSHHPARPSGFVVRRIVGVGDLWVSEYVVTYDGRPVYTVSIMEFQADKVVRETQYYAEPFDAPAWRARWVERMT